MMVAAVCNACMSHQILFLLWGGKGGQFEVAHNLPKYLSISLEVVNIMIFNPHFPGY